MRVACTYTWDQQCRVARVRILCGLSKLWVVGGHWRLLLEQYQERRVRITAELSVICVNGTLDMDLTREPTRS